MEEAGAQVAAPVVIHQPLRFCSTHTMAKKRDLPFNSATFAYQNHPSDDWNPNSWNWDSSKFIAQQLQSSDGILAGRVNGSSNARKADNREEEDESLRLKLGGMNPVDEPQAVCKPNKRVRSGSPGGTNYPMCQVDSCREDLSTSKDYHRRHKVCEVHSKASKASVGKQMQRFCQQCSRFHLLSEFDEGKRSCRRRLAGHNRRRRKPQPEDASQSLPVPSSRVNNANSGLDLVNLLALLACAQGNYENWSGKFPKEKLVEILNAINSLSLPAELASKLSHLKNKNATIASTLSSGNQSQEKGNASSPSTMDLLAALSSAPGPMSSEAFEIHSGPSTEASDSEKTKSPQTDKPLGADFQRVPINECFLLEDQDWHERDTSRNLPLQLFGSSLEDYHARKSQADRRNYLSSTSSSPSDGKSPLSSPAIVHDLFPMQTSKESVEHYLLSTNGNNNAYAKAMVSNECSTSLQLFVGPAQATGNGSMQNSPCRAGYTSSESDHSPSSMISDVQDRTGRIVFKLFDKDPSHLPGSLRTQIYNWLSNSPLEMESYIKPGCIVLSLYLSMSRFAWEQLETNLVKYVNSLSKEIDADFWGNGRFLVHTNKQSAIHNDGKIRLCKSWAAWSTPELVSVSPVAVVRGQETSLLLKGIRLTAPGTRIHSTHAFGFDAIVEPVLPCQDTSYDRIRLEKFEVKLAESGVLGRTFIEVENNFRGTSFPVIIADDKICHELRLLEREIDGSTESSNREEVLHFLNELGWLFQRMCNSSMFSIPEYKLFRFQFLLIFSVEHDFCALVKTLLGILLEFNLGKEGLAEESLKMLVESHLLHKAVKKRGRKMVDLLLHYSVIDPSDGSEKFIFTPNMAGPGDITPLHLAACTSSSDDIVDALTSDPQKVGLNCWDSILDANGLSPYAYAMTRNNNSYNSLVSRKLADQKNAQVSVFIDSETEKFQGKAEKAKISVFDVSQGQRSCSKCMLVAGYSKNVQGAQGLLQRPYIHAMLVVAAVCVCVCLFLRGHPNIGCIAPFAWENLGYGAM